MTKSIYRAYAFFIFRHLSQIIQKGIGIKMEIYPCEDGKNTVILITFEKDEDDGVDIKNDVSLSNALISVGAEHVFYSLEDVKLEGTIAYVGSDRIVFVKENKIDLFSEEAVRADILTLAQHRIGKA